MDTSSGNDPRSRQIHIHGGDLVGRDKLIYGDEIRGDKVVGDKNVFQGPAYPRLNYRSEVAHLINFYTQTFVGREREWEHLARFAGQETPGYLLVEAPPGYGKSALMAHLVHRHETGRWDQPPVPELAYFFTRQEGQRNTPVAFLQAINSQLLGTLKQPGGVPADLSLLRSQFSQLWSQALEAANRDQPLLLLVDGLDEMASGEVTIAHLLPANLAPYVHIVVFSRPNPEPLRQVTLEHPFSKADVLRLHTFEERDIEALLRGYDAAGETAAHLALRVLAMTKGEPLFARFVCQEVADEGETALVRLEREPPADVEAYFRQQFRQLDKLAEGDHTWEILGLLVVALGGMTVEEIAEALGLDRRQARKAIEPIVRFLLGETRLELMHLQLRKVLAEDFSANEQAAHRQRLLDWCQSCRMCGWPEDTPDYILAHYAQHLAEAGQNEALYALIDKRWMDVKFERTSSYRAFAEDVSRVVELARVEQPPNWVQLVRSCLIYATIGDLVTGVPPEVLGVLAQVGQIERAQGYAGLMQDAEKQARAYLLIGEALLEHEKLEKAREVLEEALAAAEAIRGEGQWDDESKKLSVLTEVAQALVRAGSFDRALAAAEALEREWHKSSVLGEIARTLAQVGEMDELNAVLEAVDTIRWKWNKVDALAGVAQALTCVGENERAVEAANQAFAAAEAGGSTKASALGNVAWVFAQAGEMDGLDRVLATLDAMKDGTEKGNALIKVSWSLAEIEEIDMLTRVAAVAEVMTDGYAQALVLSGVARALAQTGEMDIATEVANQALAAAEAIVPSLTKAHALSIVALVLAQIGNREKLNRSIAAVDGIEGGFRVLGLIWTAEAVAEAGDGDGLSRVLVALEVAGYVKHRVSALSNAAKAVAQRGEIDWARELAGHALALAKTIRSEEHELSVLGEMAQALAQIGDAYGLNQVLAMAEEIGDAERKAEALSEVAQALAQIGEMDRAAKAASEALEVAGAIGWERPNVLALSNVATALALAGEMDRAAEVARRAIVEAEEIGDAKRKVKALSEVAQALAQAGEMDRAAEAASEALEVVDSIERGMDKAWALIKAVQALAWINDRVCNQALTVVETIGNKRGRAEALSEIAQALIQKGETGKAAEVAGRALVVAESITDESDKAYALKEVAQAVAQLGEKGGLSRVLATAEAIEEKHRQANALGWLAQAMAQIGEFGQALAVVKVISDEGHKPLVLGWIAQALAEAGEPDRATELANRALLLATGKAESRLDAIRLDRSWAIGVASRVLAQGSDMEGLNQALEAAQDFQSKSYGEKGHALGEVAQALAQAGEFDQALAAAESIRHGRNKASALSGVAQTLAQAGALGRALAALETIGNRRRRAHALIETAQALIEVGQEEQAQQALLVALTTAQMAGRQSVFEVLECGATTLAAIDRSQMLWQVYEVVMEVEGWWGK